MNISIQRLFSFVLFLCCAFGLNAQNFRSGALYEVEGIPSEYEGQLFNVAEISGSWRFIDPFRHRALRLADQRLAFGEENGSDELQKWKITPAAQAGTYVIAPANVAGQSFRLMIREASSFGSDDNATYRFRSVTDRSLVLGDGDNGGNNTKIRAEKLDTLNRGQYWTIKTVGRDRHVIGGAFYETNFDDGGGNAAVKWLLQWPAQPGQWGNALMTIAPVQGQPGIYRLESVGKHKMFVMADNMMQCVEIDEADQRSWFTVEQVDKPKISAPIWEDETVFALNKLPGAATFMPYASEKEMLADKAYYQTPWTEPKSSLYQSLDGEWQFTFLGDASADFNAALMATVGDIQEDPSGRLADRHATGGSTNDLFVMLSSVQWDKTPVPSCWEMQGYDRPIYCNVEYPHSNTPPFIKARPGYNDGGQNYCINPVGVYRRTVTVDEAWLQQTGRRSILHFGGIYSSAFVYLDGHFVGYTQGANNVSEFDVTPYLHQGQNQLTVVVHRWCDGSYLECQDMFRMSGIFRSVYIYNVPETAIMNHVVTTDVRGDEAFVNVSCSMAGTCDPHAVVRLFAPDGKKVAEGTLLDGKASLRVPRPQLWSAELPALYTLHVVQSGEDGKDMIAFSTKVGIREVKIQNSLLYVNGKRVMLKGTNRHDTDPETGRTVSVASMLKDVLMMKQNNINTIRTSHYPNDARMYAMFDHYGLYVCDEADNEDHANQSISSMPSWIPSMVDRIERLVSRDINHPSVIMWSLGNEAGAGSNFKDCYEVAHQMDGTRPVHYEGTRIDKPYGGSAYSDFYSKMYPSMDWMKENTSNLDKPMFLCEYAHAMGNAIGNLPEYMQAMEESNATIGGCIWDWVDQAIYEPLELKQGIRRLHTGYDFPGPHQGNFCSNGIVTAERQYTAKLAEVKGAYQYIAFSMANDQLTLTNKYAFRSLKGLKAVCEVVVNGYVKKTIKATLPDVKPGESHIITVPESVFLKAAKGSTGETVLRVRVIDPKATVSAPAGHELAHFQQQIFVGNDLPECPSLLMEAFDAEGLEFSFQNHRWIENDRFGDTNSADKAEVSVVYSKLAGDATDVIVTVTPRNGNLRRAGVACQLPAEFSQVKYYGDGPYENYPDRNAGVLMGRYQATVDALSEPYIKPQTTGDRFVRELTLTDAAGHGYRIECPEGLYFSASRHTDADLMNARHQWELTPQPYIYLQLGRELRGLGNASCGPGPMQKYTISPDEPIRFVFRVTKI